VIVTKRQFVEKRGELVVAKRLAQCTCDDYTLDCYRQQAKKEAEKLFDVAFDSGFVFVDKQQLREFEDWLET
jgi:hypothetical protein